MNESISLLSSRESLSGIESRAHIIDCVHDDDKLAYSVCAKSWIYLVRDLCGDTAATQLYDLISHIGLYASIDMADTFAKQYLMYLEDSQLCPDVQNPFVEILYSRLSSAGSEEETTSVLLQVCRFAKRFTPLRSMLSQATLDKFLDCNRKCARYNRNCSIWPGNALLAMVREAMREIIGSESWRVLASDCCFSDGSSYLHDGMTSRDIGVKYTELLKSGLISSITVSSHAQASKIEFPDLLNSTRIPLYQEGWNPYLIRKVKVMDVPKDYSSRRLIAPEPVFMNWFGHGIREALLNAVDMTGALTYMDPEDQGTNRLLARNGSLTGEWCTIDLSSASDSIPKDLFFSVFPSEWRHVLKFVLPDYLVMPDGSRYACNMLATSGNVLTPILQCCYFLAIGRVACMLSGVATNNVYVYNDDIVIHKDAFEVMAQLLTIFGGTVNTKKTFANGPYRESCGGEFINGFDVDPKLWPRQPMPRSKVGKVQYLVTLQHRFYHIQSARMYLRSVVVSLMPNMTSSAPYSEHDDLWDPWCTTVGDLYTKHVRFVPKWVTRRMYDFVHDEMGYEIITQIAYQHFFTKEDVPVYKGDLLYALPVVDAFTLLDHYGKVPTMVASMEKPAIRNYW